MVRVYLPVLEYGDAHVHTGYTDGKNTVREYCQKALHNELWAITFAEHVRKDLDYNFDDFLLDIEEAGREFPQLMVFSGCEAKVLNTEGELDVSEDVLRRCEIVIGVFHSFDYEGKQGYIVALKAMLKNPAVDIWGHPGLFLRKHDITLEEGDLDEIIDICVENDVLIERNLKYDVPDADFVRLAAGKGAQFVIGSDAHSVDELPTIHRLRGERDWIRKMC